MWALVKLTENCREKALKPLLKLAHPLLAILKGVYLNA